MKTNNPIIKTTHEEIVKLQSNEYWGTQKNIDNQNLIYGTFLAEGLISQDWLDDRLKHTDEERLQDLITIVSKLQGVYTWGEETLGEYRKDIPLMSKGKMFSQLEYFVENNCHLEDGETSDMLFSDMITQIYK